jgi:hypothetical protein
MGDVLPGRRFALGLKPRDNDEIIRAGLESGNPAMLDLLISSGFSINPSNVPAITSRTTSPSFCCPRI